MSTIPNSVWFEPVENPPKGLDTLEPNGVGTEDKLQVIRL